MIYMDYSATTPMDPLALTTYVKVAQTYYGNSSSLHDNGEEAADALASCRESIAKCLSVENHQIYFTGSGSESNYLAITSIAMAHAYKGRHIISTESEHHSVNQTLEDLKTHGFTVTYVPLNQYGQIAAESLQACIQPDTILAVFAHASSELGTIQDFSKLSYLLKQEDIILFSDCVQSFGKVALPLEYVDAFSCSAHKIYGPKGCGAVFFKKELRWQARLKGTTHENGFRMGTVDVPAIAAFTVATEQLFNIQSSEEERMSDLRAHFLCELSKDDQYILEGHPTHRLPFHIALRRSGLEGQLLMLECRRHGFSISTSSACQAHLQEPSTSLLAIGRSKSEAHEFVRISFGKHTSKSEVTQLAQTLLHISQTFREDTHGKQKEVIRR